MNALLSKALPSKTPQNKINGELLENFIQKGAHAIPNLQITVLLLDLDDKAFVVLCMAISNIWDTNVTS